MTSPKTQAASPQFSPRSIARTFWKRKLSIIFIWIILSAAAIFGVSRIPATYTAETVILVDSQKIPEKYVSATVSTDLQDRIATISQQILSATRLKKVIDDFDLYREERKKLYDEEIIEKMRNDIAIKLEKGWARNRPGAFRITYQGPVPTVVAQVANRLANLYIDENLKTREVQAEGTSEFIQTQLQEAKKKLDELEASVSGYKLKYNGELPQQEAALIGALSRLQVELEANRDALNRAQESKVILESTLTSIEATAAVLARAPGTETSPARAQADPPAPAPPPQRKASEIAQSQLELMRGRYTAEHPDVKRLQAEVARLQAFEAGQSPDAAPEVAARPTAPSMRPQAAAPAATHPQQLPQSTQQIASLRAQIAATVKETEFRKSEQERILRDLADHQRRVSRLPIREQEMASVTRDYEISKANYRSLLDKRIAAEMATDMERRQKSERFTVLDLARVPEKPSKPNRPAFYAFGCLVALGLAVGFAFAREMHQGVLLGAWELPADIAVLACLPPIAASSSRPAGFGRWFRRKSRPVAPLVSAAISGSGSDHV